LVRALRWFKRQGVRVERVMTDNGSGYVSRLFRKVCRLLRLRHIRTRPYTPKTNGKAERFTRCSCGSGPTPCRTAVRTARRRLAPMAAPLQSGATAC
jgi:transposase InsO family protein